MAKKKINFEESLERLEEIQAQINDEEISLEDSMSLFEEGIGITRRLKAELDSLEARIEILVNEPEGDTSPDFDDFTE